MNAVAERVRAAFAERRKLRIEGAGTWLAAGQPVRADQILSLADDRGIVEYVPGDLTLTARAGTPLADIDAATRANGQWLPLDPWGGNDGTIGATVSTATFGPHAHAMGLPRDVVLGMEFVTGKGDVIRSGGRVVKNVAGFDLTRLIVGSWGTLGVITELTLRLRARPQRTRSVALAVPTTRDALNQIALKLRALPFTPLASEVVDAALASKVAVGDRSTMLIQIAGNERSLAEQLTLLKELGEPIDVGDDVWSQLRSAERDASASWRWSRLPTSFGDTWSAAANAAQAFDGAHLHGNPARGIVRVVVAKPHDPERLGRAATAFEHTVLVENLPPTAWRSLALRPTSDPVSRAIRQKFDPAGILNAGILGDA